MSEEIFIEPLFLLSDIFCHLKKTLIIVFASCVDFYERVKTKPRKRQGDSIKYDLYRWRF